MTIDFQTGPNNVSATREVSFTWLRHFPPSLGARVVMLLVFSTPVVCFAQAVVDLSGNSVDPFRANRGKIIVLVFVRRDCPISGRYAPTIQQLSAEHQSDTRFDLVFPDKSASARDASQYLHEFHYSIPALLDPGHALVKRANVHFTPEAAVFGRKGELVYHGRIDNLYIAFGRPRPAATTHELEDAINAARTGHLPPATEVAGVGCYISDLE